MYQQQQSQLRTNSRGEAYVIGPTGAPLTIRDLPPPDTGRWVIRRKAEVVAAVRGGLLSLEQARQNLFLSSDRLFCKSLIDQINFGLLHFSGKITPEFLTLLTELLLKVLQCLANPLLFRSHPGQLFR